MKDEGLQCQADPPAWKGPGDLPLEEAGFVDVEIGPAFDSFGGAKGERNARTFDVHGYPFLAVKPA